jgi:hypothetical protein
MLNTKLDLIVKYTVITKYRLRKVKFERFVPECGRIILHIESPLCETQQLGWARAVEAVRRCPVSVEISSHHLVNARSSCWGSDAVLTTFRCTERYSDNHRSEIRMVYGIIHDKSGTIFNFVSSSTSLSLLILLC